MANGVPNYLPGFEPENIKQLLDKFCNELDRRFPDKIIVWSEWDHDRLDKAAGYLVKNLGYSKGAEFLEAYGYTVVQSREEIQTNESPTIEVKRSFCPNCGAEIEGTHKFCMSCGAQLIGKSQKPAPPPIEEKYDDDQPPVKVTTKRKVTRRKDNSSAPQQTTVIQEPLKPIKKKKRHPILIVVIILLIIAFIGSRGTNGTESKTASSDTSTAKTSTSTKDSRTPAPQATPIAYTEVDITTLFSDLKSNALAAKEKYKDMYVSVRGRLSNVDASGKYIGISADKNNYDYLFDTVQCYIKSDDVKNAIMALQSDDWITVKGKITSIGEVLGYSMNIIELEVPENRQNVKTNSVSTTAGNYTPVEITTLFDDLTNNALLAKSTYKGAYVSVRGRLSNIDASGKYISISSDKNDYDHLFNSIQCYIKTEEVKKAVMGMATDSWITVKGKITDVGEILGYSMDIVEFG